EIESGSVPVIRIIKHVFKVVYELVIKDVEPSRQNKRYKTVDIGLLSKCPCPVWLCRPISEHRDKIKVAVAIAPSDIPPQGYDLSLHLLKFFHFLADTCNSELNIISYWDYGLEYFLRSHVSEKEITKILINFEN
ncbi:MAG TPA: universal stress protein, partial [Candidatus Berkiella sp.]|nr:universal stress protein [Candidatus Berkiella sp.]